jgi:hypothetical protein
MIRPINLFITLLSQMDLHDKQYTYQKGLLCKNDKENPNPITKI